MQTPMGFLDSCINCWRLERIAGIGCFVSRDYNNLRTGVVPDRMIHCQFRSTSSHMPKEWELQRWLTGFYFSLKFGDRG